MRYPASEKAEIIQLVEQSHLSVKRTRRCSLDQRRPLARRRLSAEPLFTCKACGERGAEVRPNFQPARMGAGW
jgi:hypothetical protein